MDEKKMFNQAGGHLQFAWNKSHFYVLVLFVICNFALGGSSRNEIPSLIFLVPLSVLGLAYALLSLRSRVAFDNRVILTAFGIVALTAIAHLIPMPQHIWAALPGRALTYKIVSHASEQPVWLPLTLTPVEGRYAVYGLMAPLAAALIAININKVQQMRIAVVILFFGIVTALVALMQALEVMAPFYKISSDTPSGIFANRNHHAVFVCAMIPLSLVVIQNYLGKVKNNYRKLIFLSFYLFIVIPTLILSSSRTGFITGLIMLPITFLVFERAPVLNSRPGRAFFVKLIASIFFALTILFTIGQMSSRVNAINRMEYIFQDVRIPIWMEVMTFLPSYLPLGSGLGSAPKTYQIHEPVERLHPTYLNHLHNDWLEIILTMGLPGVCILASGVILYCLRARFLFAHGVGANPLQALGMTVVAIFAIASFVDYPLRTPSLATFAAIAVVWAAFPVSNRNVKLGTKCEDFK